MKSPGVECGRSTDQRASLISPSLLHRCVIPDSQRLGAVNDGGTLSDHADERAQSIGGAFRPASRNCSFLQQPHCEEGPAIDDRSVRSRLRLWGEPAASEHYHARDLGAVEMQRPGPGEPIGTLVADRWSGIAMYALDLQGAAGGLSGLNRGRVKFRRCCWRCRAPASGGTTECATSSPSACLVCPAIQVTRTCRSTDPTKGRA